MVESIKTVKAADKVTSIVRTSLKGSFSQNKNSLSAPDGTQTRSPPTGQLEPESPTTSRQAEPEGTFRLNHQSQRNMVPPAKNQKTKSLQKYQ